MERFPSAGALAPALYEAGTSASPTRPTTDRFTLRNCPQYRGRFTPACPRLL